MEYAFIAIPLAIAFAILVRVAAGAFDNDRIRRYVAARGGRVLHCRWTPFGPGWFGEKSDRIYRVRYADRAGHVHDAHCKTSFWTGVYFTEDRIVRPAHGTEPVAHTVEALEEENRLLRAEIERLKRIYGA